MKPRSANGLKTVPTTCTYNRDGNLIACACQDGSIQMWDHRKAFVSVSISSFSLVLKKRKLTCKGIVNVVCR